MSDTTTPQRFSFRTITTKFPAKCRRCDQAIGVGTRVRWAQKSGTYHLAAECGTQPELPTAVDPADAALKYRLAGGKG